jgi:hypothetical protein
LVSREKTAPAGRRDSLGHLERREISVLRESGVTMGHRGRREILEVRVLRVL